MAAALATLRCGCCLGRPRGRRYLLLRRCRVRALVRLIVLVSSLTGKAVSARASRLRLCAGRALLDARRTSPSVVIVLSLIVLTMVAAAAAVTVALAAAACPAFPAVFVFFRALLPPVLLGAASAPPPCPCRACSYPDPKQERGGELKINDRFPLRDLEVSTVQYLPRYPGTRYSSNREMRSPSLTI